jgi:hypothetical protein
LRPHLTTGLPFLLAHKGAHALIRLHHTLNPSPTQSPLEVFPAVGRCLRVALRHTLSFMPALLPESDESAMNFEAVSVSFHEDGQGQARRADPIEGFERHDAGDQDERQAAQRPGQPCGGTAAHPTDFLPVFPCPFCHNPTLQRYRLPNVTSREFRNDSPFSGIAETLGSILFPGASSWGAHKGPRSHC